MTNEQELLVTNNTGLVGYMAKKLSEGKYAYLYQDLASEGMIGLVKAATRFDPDKGVKFCTFAGRCVKNEMLMFLRRNVKHHNAVSLYSPVAGDAGNELLLMDIIEDAGSSVEGFEKKLFVEETLKELNDRLTDRERAVVVCIAEGKTQLAMAKELGFSQSYVSRFIRNMRKKHRRLIACG